MIRQIVQQIQTANTYATIPNITSSTASNNANYTLAVLDNANLNADLAGSGEVRALVACQWMPTASL